MKSLYRFKAYVAMNISDDGDKVASQNGFCSDIIS